MNTNRVLAHIDLGIYAYKLQSQWYIVNFHNNTVMETDYNTVKNSTDEFLPYNNSNSLDNNIETFIEVQKRIIQFKHNKTLQLV